MVVTGIFTDPFDNPHAPIVCALADDPVTEFIAPIQIPANAILLNILPPRDLMELTLGSLPLLFISSLDRRQIGLFIVL
jgi:hypothetical protein